MSDDDYEPAITGNMTEQTAAEISEGPSDVKPAAELMSDALITSDRNSDSSVPTRRTGSAILRAATLKMLADACREVQGRRAAKSASLADDLEPMNAPRSSSPPHLPATARATGARARRRRGPAP